MTDQKILGFTMIAVGLALMIISVVWMFSAVNHVKQEHALKVRLISGMVLEVMGVQRGHEYTAEELETAIKQQYRDPPDRLFLQVALVRLCDELQPPPVTSRLTDDDTLVYALA